MKLTAIAIQKWNGANKEATSLGLAADVSSYGYFQRGPVQQMMAFVSRTVAQRTLPGQRQSVQQVSTSLAPDAGATLRFRDHQRLCAGACRVPKRGPASYLAAALACKGPLEAGLSKQPRRPLSGGLTDMHLCIFAMQKCRRICSPFRYDC